MSSETRRAFAEDGARKTHIGGQALIEGIMMRGKKGWSVAVREPDGSLYVEEHPLSAKGDRPTWMEWPLVRGCVALVDSLALGYKALGIAAEHAYDAEGETFASLQESKKDVPAAEYDARVGEPAAAGPAASESTSGEAAEGIFGKSEMVISMTLGIVLGVALFILLPAFLSNLLIGDYDVNPFAWNVTDGILRVAIFVFYVWLIGRIPDIKRMFSYHGAEHKTIHCFEHGLELTPANAASFPRLHVRCGTAFLVMVMIIAIFVYTVIPVDRLLIAWGLTDSVLKFLLVVAIRILLLPVIAGVTYEITVKWAGSHPENPVVKVVLWPGMQMQRLTTNEPDAGMLEAAIAAMQRVIEQERREA